MNIVSPALPAPIVPLSVDPVARRDAPTASILAAAALLLPHLERGTRIDAAVLRGAMQAAFYGSDASATWDWKAAYEACEVATVLFLRRYGPALFAKAATPAARLRLIERIAALLPTQTRRSEESRTLQQFSTPIGLGFAAVTAAAITPADQVLEPSAGTGLLAIFPEIAGGALALNELAGTRRDLLAALFPAASVSRFDGAQVDDHLDPNFQPSVVLMNPPFSVLANVEGHIADAAFRHVASALARLAPGGRLVAITGAGFAADNPAWAGAFAELQARGRIVFSAAIDGAVYARHGTSVATRLTVIDKGPTDGAALPEAPGIAPDVATLLGWIEAMVPPRLPVEGLAPRPGGVAPRANAKGGTRQGAMRPAGAAAPAATVADPKAADLEYELLDAAATGEAHHRMGVVYGLYSKRDA